MIQIKDVSTYLEEIAPLHYQEDYDNSGLIVGDPYEKVNGILISLDATEEVIDEAIKHDCNLIVSHHPIVFKGLKTLTGSDYVQRTVLKAIRNNIALYAIHTNLDNVYGGVNAKIAERLGLTNSKILVQKGSALSKLVTFLPHENKKDILNALFEAGVGRIGEYEHCSFSVDGTGTYRPTEEAKPYIGSTGTEETVKEARVEVIFPTFLQSRVESALKSAHPYEEVAFYITGLDNANPEVGSGLIGKLPSAMEPVEFLKMLKEKMETPLIRHSPLTNIDKIEKVAVCGGSGSFLTKAAIRKGADIFITGDIKYHDFFDADNKIIIADIGHYESEVFTKDLLHDLLMKKFNTFALHLSETVTNPINYF